MTRSPRRMAAAVIVALLLALSACAAPAARPAPSPASVTPVPSAPAAPLDLSPEDAAAMAQLADVAPRTSTIDPALADWTECWLPSDSLIPADQVGNATTWKVICRIHWHQKDGTARYQDTNCIGDFAAQPMLDHCYRWVYYDFEPRFEDHPGVPAIM
jgi:hypothetical protein